MSANATLSEPWVGLLTQPQWPSTPRLLLLALINVPLLSIVVNALWQLLPRKKSDPPMVWHWIPLFGSAASYGQDPVGFFRACREKYGNVFTFMLIGRRVTVTLGPQGNDYVFGGKHSQLAAEDVYSPLTTPVFGKDVVYDCPNELLMEQKKFVKFSLTVERFRTYVGMIEEEIDGYINKDPKFAAWQSNDINEWGAFPVLQTLSELTILTASRTLQGKEIREAITKDYAQTMHDLDHGFTPIHWLMPGLPLPSYRKRDVAHKRISEFYQSIIRRRREHPEEAHEDDVMSSLMQQKYRDGRAIRDHEVAHMLIALLMAGQHTSSSSIAWTLLHIAHRPDMQEALYKEQVKHFGTPDGKLRDITWDDLRELKVLDGVIRETLRMHPPIHSIMRKAHTDIPVPATLSSPSEDDIYVVPKGDIVLASPAISQLDPTTWTNSEQWEPSRWFDTDGVAAQAHKAYEESQKVDFGFGLVSKGTISPYLPFGAGRHRCIGEQFAHLQMSTIISVFVRRMELKLEGEFPKSDYSSMMVQPFPCKIQYRRRDFD